MNNMELFKLIRDKGEHYRAIISVNGVQFESIYILKIERWCQFFNMTEDEISKYFSDYDKNRDK